VKALASSAKLPALHASLPPTIAPPASADSPRRAGSAGTTPTSASDSSSRALPPTSWP
jgi:hypothetical protein